MITAETTVKYTCSDGTELLNKLDAELHEADLALKAVCDKHGYSAESFTRGDLYRMLLEHAADFGTVLAGYLSAAAAKRASLATGGAGSLAAAFTGKKSTDVQELQRRVSGLRGALHDISLNTKEPDTRARADNACDAYPAVGIANT